MPKLTPKPLTEMSIRKAKAKPARYDVFDGMVRGFGLRVSTAGSKSWFVMRRVNGRNTRYTFGRYPEIGLSDARKQALDLLAGMSKGDTPKEAQSDIFDVVLEEWFLRDQAKNKSVGQVRGALEYHVLPVLQGRPITAIQKKDILRIVDRIADSGARTQANRVLAFMRRFFNWCIERDLLVANPTAGIKLAAGKSRDRVLNLDEIRLLLSVLKEVGYPFGPMTKILLLTGQRLKEVAEASWSEIDIERREWIIPSARTKNGRQHIVHLSAPVLEALKSLPRIEGQDWLFSTNQVRPVSGFSKAKSRIDDATGIQDWTFHDLRRSFATHTTERLGISTVVVDKIQNHLSGSVRGVTATYQRGEYLEQRRQALDAWGEEFFSKNGPQNMQLLSKIADGSHEV